MVREDVIAALRDGGIHGREAVRMLAEQIGKTPHNAANHIRNAEKSGWLAVEREDGRIVGLDLVEGAAIAPAPRSTPTRDLSAAGAVNAYLAELDQQTTSLYAHRSMTFLEERRGKLEAEMLTATTGVARVKAAQAKREIERALAERKNGSRAHDAFVSCVKSYSEQFGIEYETWRELGVPAAVLKEGGM